VALALLAVVLLVQPLFRAQVPTHEEWLAAAEHVESNWRQGDVVRIEPGWLTAGRVYLRDVDGGKREPFRILDIHAPVDTAWLYRFERLWLAAALDETDNYEEIVPPGASLVGEYSFGNLDLLLFELPRDVIRWQLQDGLKMTVLEREGADGQMSQCRFKGKSFRCRESAGPGAKVELRRVAGSARNCLVLRPGPEGSITRLRVSGVRGPGRLLVRLGNTVEAARAKHGSDVHARVTLGDDVLAELVIERRAYRLDEVSRLLAEEEKELVISLSATDDRKREICVDGYLLDDQRVESVAGTRD